MALFNQNNNNLKMCQSCRAVIPAQATVCEMCGAEGHYARRAGDTGEESFSWSVTVVLLTLNVVIYALVLLYQQWVFEGVPGAPGFSFTPYSRALSAFGSADAARVNAGQWWRLLAACFLHGGVMHIFFNSMGLMQAGRIAEDIFGGAQFLCLYVLAGIAGNLLAVGTGSSVVGASGSVFGVIAALAVYGYKRRDSFGQNLKSFMMQWLVYGLVISFLPGISWQAHIGGLLGGAAIAWVMPDEEQLRRRMASVRLAQVGAAVCVLLIIGTFVAAAGSVRGQVWGMRAGNLEEAAVNAHNNYRTWLTKPEADTQRVLCTDVTALERIAAVDAATEQLKQRLLEMVRTACAAQGPMSSPALDERVAKLNRWTEDFKAWQKQAQ